MAGSVAAAVLPGARSFALSPIINDVTRLNPVEVRQLGTPHDTDEIKELVKNWRGPISIGGGRYSMGGQVATTDSLHLDMREFNKLVRLDVASKTVRVQSGMRWRDLQALIDPHGLAVKIMQSYSNFTVGGALSVNAHGRYVGAGPVVNSVRSIELVLPGGLIIEASREQAPDLFYGAIGGYGGLGVIAEIELDLVPNIRMERRVENLSLASYGNFFRNRILGNSDAILHNADMDLAGSDEVTAVTWVRTERPATVQENLRAIGESYSKEAVEVWVLSEIPNAQRIRRSLVDPLQYRTQPVVWRNYEASLDVASLGKIATDKHTFALDEFFIPVDHFEEFAREMVRILAAHRVNALNVSIRHAPKDTQTLMAWAQHDIFSFVLYYKQSTTPTAQREVGEWTRKLIDAALAVGGTYYLPYQLHATRDQFQRAYPNAGRFLTLKTEVDPERQFRNKLWDKYILA